MFNYFSQARKFANIEKEYRCEALDANTVSSKGSMFVVLRNALMVMGISAMVTLGVMFFNPGMGDQLLAFSPFADKPATETSAQHEQLSALVPATPANVASAKPAEASKPEAKAPAVSKQQKWVTEWIAKRYRVANDAANMLVSAAYATAVETKLDPLLILSVIAIESRFNPFAESPMGAQGLMQVMAKVHKDKFEDHGGVKAALNPVTNIKVGSEILREYVRRGGSVEAGLKSYVGAADHETDGGYGSKVLSEYHRLKDVASGKRVPSTAVAQSKRKSNAKPKAADAEAETVAVARPEKTEKNL